MGVLAINHEQVRILGPDLLAKLCGQIDLSNVKPHTAHCGVHAGIARGLIHIGTPTPHLH